MTQSIAKLVYLTRAEDIERISMHLAIYPCNDNAVYKIHITLKTASKVLPIARGSLLTSMFMSAAVVHGSIQLNIHFSASTFLEVRSCKES